MDYLIGLKEHARRANRSESSIRRDMKAGKIPPSRPRASKWCRHLWPLSVILQHYGLQPTERDKQSDTDNHPSL